MSAPPVLDKELHRARPPRLVRTRAGPGRPMSATEVATVLFGLATVALAVGFSVPQLVRLRRTGDANGISLAATTNSAISFTAWTWYALVEADLWLLLSSAVGIPGGVATVVLAWRRGAARQGLAVPVVWTAVLLGCSALDALLGASMFAVAVGASVLWLLVPALTTAYRTHDLSGVAVGSWLVLAAEGALFLGYGLLASVPASVLYGVVTLVGCAAMLARLATVRRPDVARRTAQASRRSNSTVPTTIRTTAQAQKTPRPDQGVSGPSTSPRAVAALAARNGST